MASGTSRAWFIVPAAAVLVIVLTVWSTKSQTATHALYEGKDDVIVTLSTTSGSAKDALPAIIDRFVSVGIDAEALDADEHQARIELRRVSEPKETVLGILGTEPLQFQVIASDQSTHLEDGGVLAPEGGQFDAGVNLGGEHAHPWLLGEGRAKTLERALQTPHPEGEVPVLECIPGEDKSAPVRCAVWRSLPPLPLGVKNVTSTHVGADKITEEPLVRMMFDPAGAKVLEQVSREHAGQMLAVVAFGELAARPELKQPIESGGFEFSTRTGDTDRTESVLRAERIVAAAKATPLPQMKIESIEPVKVKKK